MIFSRKAWAILGESAASKKPVVALGTPEGIDAYQRSNIFDYSAPV
jgi:hypothetical protein